MNEISDITLQAMRAVIKRKEEANIHHSSALMEEINQEVMRILDPMIKETLNSFVKDGILIFHRTVNSVSFQFK